MRERRDESRERNVMERASGGVGSIAASEFGLNEFVVVAFGRAAAAAAD